MRTEISYRFLSVVLQRIWFEIAVYKTIFMAADYLCVEVLIGTRFMSRLVNFICYIDQQVEFTKGTIQLLEIAMDEPTVDGLNYMEDDFSGSITDTPA